ncbi:MAG TPA: SDR family NAD(P)-dependent oxidoreductase [Deltaproteobacteria bacterium]|nr:SDR family NAD(P)-dependent oxidoreductase [Deltaproteobacteria bacterium]
MYTIAGRHVLITGAASGIGRALSGCFAREGAHLFLGAHPAEEAKIKTWADELSGRYGVKTWTFPVDLSHADGPETLYWQVNALGLPTDVLVNNAGLIAYGNLHQIPLDRQEQIIRVNALAYFKLMRLILPDMIKRGQGRVLNVSSVSAFQPTAHHAVYGATKAFVQSLSEAVNAELAGTGVKVATFNPSYTNTPLLKGEGFPKQLWWYAFSGLNSPEEVAEKGFQAFKADKSFYIPGWHNWFVHAVLQRFVPRRLAVLISALVLKPRS